MITARRIAARLALLLPALGGILFAGDYPAAATGDYSLRFSEDGRYAFPVAAAVETMSWTYTHWDGSNAVDIFADSALSMDSRAFAEFAHAPVVAVTSGSLRRADNRRGGIALVLDGDDGMRYYYAHLREAALGPTAGSRRVQVGEQIGTVGKTGRWTRWIEPHLHFEVSTRSDGDDLWAPEVNAADWLRETFGLEWAAQDIPPYAAGRPEHPPLSVCAEIVRTYAEMQHIHPDLASIEIAPASASLAPERSERPRHYTVLSPLQGEVRVHRNAHLGLRIQVTNRHYDETIVLSGLEQATVEAAGVVAAGDRLGYAAQGRSVNLMYFREGRLTDPTPLLHRCSEHRGDLLLDWPAYLTRTRPAVTVELSNVFCYPISFR